MERRDFLKQSLALAAAGTAGVMAGCNVLRGLLPKPPNIVCILVDQLRKDTFDELAPMATALSRRGVRFEQMRSAAPWTYPSVLSLMSGLYPQQHGAYGWLSARKLSTFNPELPLVHRIMRSAGYTTSAYITNPFLHTWNSFHVGFDFFDAHFVKDTGTTIPHPQDFAIPKKMFATEVNASVRADFDGRAQKGPEFTYIHYIDVHGPWNGAPFKPNYQASVRFIDGKIVELYEYFMERYDGNLAFFVTADHGRELGDELNIGAGRPWRKRKHSCHDFNLHIPFHLLPSKLTPTPRSIDQVCSNVDFVPTVLELAGIEIPEFTVGRSLVPLIRGDIDATPERVIYAKVADPGARSDAVVYHRKKYMRYFDAGTDNVTATRLFDLAEDPREITPLDEIDPIYDTYIEKLSGTLGHAWPPEDARLSDRTRRELEALGYMR